jgi:flagellin-like hook-associated protein FlgL
MSVNDISLTAGMRNNLLSLQSTTGLINRTQTRLSSGKAVNTALDNPTNFFAAQTGVARANDLSGRKDGMSEAVQMVNAANAGITGITSLIEAAKGVAQSALATTSTTDRTTFAATFDTLLTQITQLSSDSGYRGTNLLNAGASQTVEFAPTTNAATLQIKGFDATSSGLGISATGGAGSTSTVTPAPDFTVTGIQMYMGLQGPGGVVAINDNLFTGAEHADIAANPTNYRFTFAGGGVAKISTPPINGWGQPDGTIISGNIDWGYATTLEHYAGGVNQTTGAPNPVTTTTSGGNSWGTTAGIQSSASQLETALTTLRNQSSNLSANLSVVTTRQNFTDQMVSTLQTGADNLTLADMNKEGANMLMLETRQNLGITSLSMASQAAQSVLKLF